MSASSGPDGVRGGAADGARQWLPRVLLVEDDPTVRRFTELALEDLPMQLLWAGTVPDALHLLASGPFCLILTDLMLPGEPGQALLRRLQVQPALAGAALLAVYSAGLSPAVRTELQSLGVWRMLHKPVPLAELRQCVAEALGTPAPAAAPAVAAGAAGGDVDVRSQAINSYFAGNTRLYETYLAACLQQFPQDLQEGDQALAADDWNGLRRLGHSLKTVLRTLGYEPDGAQARELEAAGAAQDGAAAALAWQALRAAMLGLAAQVGGPVQPPG